MSAAEASLGDLLAELLDEVDDVEVLADREYARNGVAFAARTSENVIELRLRADVADAALRTPDTEPSGRGEEWVAFAAADWNDPLARDRLLAWFRLAWRAAGR